MDIKSLKKTSSSHKAKLTIFKTYIDSLLPSKRVNEVQAFELKARLDKILDLYNEFDSVQTDLESLVEISDDEHKEREIFENSYFGCVAFAQKMLSAASADQDAGSVTGSNINTGPSGHDEQRCRLSSCKLCTQRHNTLLHNKNTVPEASTSSAGCVVLPTVQEQTQKESSGVTLSSTHHSQNCRSETNGAQIEDNHSQERWFSLKMIGCPPIDGCWDVSPQFTQALTASTGWQT
ncbi:uncharacterized protein LOC119630755 [Bombyx mori]|uniref:uncharacterized protein LOC119630755 n=1 Tax=Bombyx mori TaxID=7091 RepID=UPI002ED19AB9